MVYSIKMTTIKIVLSIITILLGVFLFLFGGYDDSPGAQGLGVLVIIVGIVCIVRNKNK